MSIYDKNGYLKTRGIRASITREAVPCKGKGRFPGCRGTTHGLWEYCTNCRHAILVRQGDEIVKRSRKGKKSADGSIDDIIKTYRKIDEHL